MDTARCKAFVAAVKKGSFTQAAEELNYTTSAVSQLITGLEEDLHVTLFHRSRKGVSLTADGERLYPVIHQLVRQEELIYETAATISGVLIGKIVIAAYPSICAAWLPQIIHRFRNRYPGVDVRIDDSIRKYVLEAVNSGHADIGFLGNHHDFSGEWFDIERNPIVAVVGKNSTYAEWDTFPLSECERVNLIQASYGSDQDLSSIFDKHQLTPNIVYTTRNSSTAAAMVQHNMGVLLVNELSTHMWNFNIKVLPLNPPQYVSLGMVISPQSSASPAVKAFIQVVREWLVEKKNYTL